MFELKNKVALITGAGRGLGRTHALTLASQGARVIATDINKDDCEKVVYDIKQLGKDALALKMDVTNSLEINEAIKKSASHFGRLDILVNNAGIFFHKDAFKMTAEDWDRMFAVNLKGQFFCAQRAAEEMAKNKWGRIINISSIASGQGGVGVPGGVHYAASKAGIIGMTMSLAIEWAHLGITVNAIAPALVDTLMAATLPKSVVEERIHRSPLKRICTPEEVSHAVAFLASEEASYITGTTLYIDGGRLAT